MNPHNNPNFYRGRPYNPNFNNQDRRSRDLSRWTHLYPNLSNMHALNPNFTRPLMPQNNPLNASQLHALFQYYFFYHLQTQILLYYGFNQEAIPYTGLPNQLTQFAQNQIFYGNQATGVQNAQFIQSPIFPANQMMGHLGVGSTPATVGQNEGYQSTNAGVGSAPAIVGQNEGYQSTNAGVKQNNHNGRSTSAKTPQILRTERSHDRFQNLQTTHNLNPRGKGGGGRGGQHSVAVQGPSSMNLSEKGLTNSNRCAKDTTASVQVENQAHKRNVPAVANTEEKKAGKRRNIEDADAKSLSGLPTKHAKTSEQCRPGKRLHAGRGSDIWTEEEHFAFLTHLEESFLRRMYEPGSGSAPRMDSAVPSSVSNSNSDHGHDGHDREVELIDTEKKEQKEDVEEGEDGCT